MTPITLIKTAEEAKSLLLFIQSDLKYHPNRYTYQIAESGSSGSVIFQINFTSPEEAYYFGLRQATAEFGY